MKSVRISSLLAIAALAISVTGGMRPAAAQESGKMAGEAAMMKKMMESRPKAIKNADAAVQKHKAAAAKKGMYGCCLKTPCDQCALKMGTCPCGKNAAMDKPVCHECKGGWAAGNGAIPGKTADDIKVMPRMEMGGKMSKSAPSKMTKKVVFNTCPMMGSKVTGKGAGMSLVGNYEVHFCCAGCKPGFDKLSKKEQMAKIQTALATK